MKNLNLLIVLVFVLVIGGCENTPQEPWRGVEIHSFSPSEGKPRDTITIRGANFKTINTNTVLFWEDRPAHVVEWEPDRLRVLVPDSGVVTGPISVRVSVKEIAVSQESFKFDDRTPVIISLSPDFGLSSTEVVIRGANFAETGNRVTFDGVAAKIVKQGRFGITVEVPQGLPDGEVDVVVTSNGIASEPAVFEVGIIFRDTFDRGETEWADKNELPNPVGTDWYTVSGQLRIFDRYLDTQGGGKALFQPYGSALIAGDGLSWRVKCDFRIKVLDDACFGGVMFNAQNEEQYYVLRVAGNGLVQVLSTADGGAGWGVYYSNNHEVEGGDDFYTAEISCDEPGTFYVRIVSDAGEELFSNTVVDGEARYNGGYAGIWGLGDHTQYDNMEVLLK